MEDPAPLPMPPERIRRLVYFGTPAMAVPPLRAVHGAGFEVSLVITGPDRRRGRRAEPSPTPVKQCALELGLTVSHDPADAISVEADLGVVVAFGQILRPPLLGTLPMVNIHFSLLPRWRGAAPVERAILAGDQRTGVCLMAVEAGLDTGGVYASAETPIGASETAAQLSARLTEMGSTLLVDSLTSGLGPAVPQSGEATHAAKLTTEDRLLDWSRPAVELDRVVRVGGAWTTYGDKRLKVHVSRPRPEAGPPPPGSLHGDVVTTGDGSLQLVEVQPEGRARVGFDDWANGARPPAGVVLGPGPETSDAVTPT